MPLPGDLPEPEIQPVSAVSPLQADSFTADPQGKHPCYLKTYSLTVVN